MNRIIKANIIPNINNTTITMNEDNRIKKDSRYKLNLKSFIENKLFTNGMIALSSGLIYVTFDKYIRVSKPQETIHLFRPAFIFTFCLCPILISIYFTKLDYEYLKIR